MDLISLHKNSRFWGNLCKKKKISDFYKKQQFRYFIGTLHKITYKSTESSNKAGSGVVGGLQSYLLKTVQSPTLISEKPAFRMLNAALGTYLIITLRQEEKAASTHVFICLFYLRDGILSEIYFRKLAA